MLLCLLLVIGCSNVLGKGGIVQLRDEKLGWVYSPLTLSEKNWRVWQVQLRHQVKEQHKRSQVAKNKNKITTWRLMKDLKELGFSFVEGTPIHGKPNWVGKKGAIIVQLLGSEDNLVEASAMALLSDDDVENTFSIAGFWLFAACVDSSSYEWIKHETIEGLKSLVSGTFYQTRRRFGEKVFEFECKPLLNLTVLFVTVRPAQQLKERSVPRSP